MAGVFRSAVWAGVLGLGAAGLSAHQPGYSFLTLEVEGRVVRGQLELSLAELNAALNLDSDGNGSVTYDEYLEHQERIAGYVRTHLRLRADETELALEHFEQGLGLHDDGVFARAAFQAPAPRPPALLHVEYRLFFDLDPQHRALVRLEQEGDQQLAVFRPGNAHYTFPLETRSVPLRPWGFVIEGVWHIWIGFDHLLFLVALLLPAVLRRVEGSWQPVENFKPAFLRIVSIVTAFTVAHSITLGLAVLELVRLPERPVEFVIALSVLIAAANNLRPFVHRRAWLVALGFGLVHGFGFANVLLDLELPAATLGLALLSFNAGVELGQLAVVALLMPLAFGVRASAFYHRMAVPAGSTLIMLLAAAWMVERGLGIA